MSDNMKEIIKALVFVLFVAFLFTLGAYAHEKDINRNCLYKGYTQGWIENYKCDVSDE